MWKIVFIAFALVQAIQCRTNQDVINDFEPIFRERHDAISALKKSTESRMDPIFKHFDEQLRNQGENISGYLLPESIERIGNNITEYIKQIGLENHPELTKPCLEAAEASVNRNMFLVNGAGRGVYELAMDHLAKIYLHNYTDTINATENEHALIDKSKEDCVKLNTPFDVQSCLINFLYTYYIPHLEHLNVEVNHKIINWTIRLNLVENTIVIPGFNLVRKDITNYEEQTISETNICLWAIPKPSSQ